MALIGILLMLFGILILLVRSILASVYTPPKQSKDTFANLEKEDIIIHIN